MKIRKKLRLMMMKKMMPGSKTRRKVNAQTLCDSFRIIKIAENEKNF
jgi:hypothetical protein